MEEKQDYILQKQANECGLVQNGFQNPQNENDKLNGIQKILKSMSFEEDNNQDTIDVLQHTFFSQKMVDILDQLEEIQFIQKFKVDYMNQLKELNQLLNSYQIGKVDEIQFKKHIEQLINVIQQLKIHLELTIESQKQSENNINQYDQALKILNNEIQSLNKKIQLPQKYCKIVIGNYHFIDQMSYFFWRTEVLMDEYLLNIKNQKQSEKINIEQIENVKQKLSIYKKQINNLIVQNQNFKIVDKVYDFKTKVNGQIFRGFKYLFQEVSHIVSQSKTQEKSIFDFYQFFESPIIKIKQEITEQFKIKNVKGNKLKEFYEKRQEMDKQLLNVQFPTLSYCNNYLSVLALRIFEMQGYLEKIQNFSSEKMYNIIKQIQHSYFIIPYHNFAHGFLVMHLTFSVPYKSQQFMQFIKEDEQFITLFAALSHDLGHEGVNNSYYNKFNLELSLKYMGNAVLENMHASKMFKILKKNPELDIFELMSGGDVQKSNKYKKLFVKIILATDMSIHQKQCQSLKKKIYATNKINNDPEYINDPQYSIDKELFYLDPKEYKSRKALLKYLVHASDLGMCIQEINQYHNWSILLQQEFLDQQLLEKYNEEKIEIIQNKDSQIQYEEIDLYRQNPEIQITKFHFMDQISRKHSICGFHKKIDLFKEQLFFISTFSLPLWENLGFLFSDLNEVCVKKIKDNVQEIKTQIEIQNQNQNLAQVQQDYIEQQQKKKKDEKSQQKINEQLIQNCNGKDNLNYSSSDQNIQFMKQKQENYKQLDKINVKIKLGKRIGIQLHDQEIRKKSNSAIQIQQSTKN